jgi:hypothetical protein
MVGSMKYRFDCIWCLASFGLVECPVLDRWRLECPFDFVFAAELFEIHILVVIARPLIQMISMRAPWQPHE